MIRKSPMKQENRQTISGADFEEYFQPQNLEKALEIKAEYEDQIEVAAGTTDLLVANYEQLHQIKNWLDLDKLDELRKIEILENELHIGAMVTHLQLMKSDLIKEKLAVLAAAAEDVGSPQIRSRGTIGGNICTSSPAGDLLAPLLSYEASFKLQKAGAERIVRAEDFFTGPKRNLMEADELLTEIIIPLTENEREGAWVKVGRRKALVISTLTLAVVLEFEADKIIKAGIAMGSVAPTPVRLWEVGELLLGSSLTELDYKQLGQEVKARINPIDDLRGTREYREDVAADVMVRALNEIERKRG
ncbi:MAG: FAD binding domain-containing protein [Halanaerobiales bacterium]|nr:FAD binding domain-containing protein [Halanaerobiales bacterium]